MSDSGLGVLLRKLREKNQLSLRAAGDAAKVDHAYIHRLETGAKEAPSAEILEKLIAAFHATESEVEMLEYLANNPDVDPALVAYVLGQADVSFEVFSAAAGARHRGGGRPDPETLIKRIKSVFEE